MNRTFVLQASRLMKVHEGILQNALVNIQYLEQVQTNLFDIRTVHFFGRADGWMEIKVGESAACASLASSSSSSVP